MGLFDQIAGQVLGSAMQGATGASPSLLPALLEMIGGPKIGGLAGLLQMFQSKGLQNILQSWISTGPNLPVSPDQLTSVFGSGLLGELAGKAGIPTDQIAGTLSGVLPNMVDKLTPEGSAPAKLPDVGDALKMLGGLFG